MSAPVGERPETLARSDGRLVVRDADEFGVRWAALYADPVEVSRHMAESDGVGDLVGPEEAFAFGVIAVPGCVPGAGEVGVFGLPDVVGSVNWVDGLGGV